MKGEVDGMGGGMEGRGGWKADVNVKRWRRMEGRGGSYMGEDGKRWRMERGGWKDPIKPIDQVQTYGTLPRDQPGRRRRKASLIPYYLLACHSVLFIMSDYRIKKAMSGRPADRKVFTYPILGRFRNGLFRPAKMDVNRAYIGLEGPIKRVQSKGAEETTRKK